MSNVNFSASTDKFAETRVIKELPHLSKIEDWEPVNDFWSDVYYGKDVLPEGKRRKAGTLELEDIPPPSNDELFAEEMDALNTEYDKNMSILANKYNIAVARDGSQETAKVESARAEISTLDAQYESDQLAILNKYYGA